MVHRLDQTLSEVGDPVASSDHPFLRSALFVRSPYLPGYGKWTFGFRDPTATGVQKSKGSVQGRAGGGGMYQEL